MLGFSLSSFIVVCGVILASPYSAAHAGSAKASSIPMYTAAVQSLCFISAPPFYPTCSSQNAAASVNQPSASVPLPAPTACGALSYT